MPGKQRLLCTLNKEAGCSTRIRCSILMFRLIPHLNAFFFNPIHYIRITSLLSFPPSRISHLSPDENRKYHDLFQADQV